MSDYSNLEPAKLIRATPPKLGFFSKLGFVSKAIFLKAHRDLYRATIEKNEYKDEIAHLKKKLSEFGSRLDSVVALREENEALRYCVTELFQFNKRHYGNSYFQRHILTECCRALGLNFFDEFKEHCAIAKTNGQGEKTKNKDLYRDYNAAKSAYSTWVASSMAKLTFEEWLYESPDDTTLDACAKSDSSADKPMQAKELLSTVEEAETFLMGFDAQREGMATGYYHTAAQKLFGEATPALLADVTEAKKLIAAKKRNEQRQEATNG